MAFLAGEVWCMPAMKISEWHSFSPMRLYAYINMTDMRLVDMIVSNLTKCHPYIREARCILTKCNYFAVIAHSLPGDIDVNRRRSPSVPFVI